MKRLLRKNACFLGGISQSLACSSLQRNHVVVAAKCHGDDRIGRPEQARQGRGEGCVQSARRTGFVRRADSKMVIIALLSAVRRSFSYI